jgi:hypothetical protein
MGKVSEKDYAEMSTRLRGRAARIMRQLDAGAGYRQQIEQEIARRTGAPVIGPAGQDAPDAGGAAKQGTIGGSVMRAPLGASPAQDLSYKVCAACQTQNDPDAKFCKACGHKVEVQS